MYFENLKNIKTNNWIRKSDIVKLDEWLARIPYRNRGNLNFLKFSIDEDINEDIAFELFIKASQKHINILNISYNVVTDDKMHNLGVFDTFDDIPSKIFSYEFNKDIKIKDSNIEIRFKLIAHPSETPAISPSKKKKMLLTVI